MTDDSALKVLSELAVFRALREDEKEECLNLWTTVWPGKNSRSYFERYFYGDVEWLPYYTQVAEVDNRLVSAVQICKRVVACGEFSLTMGGIANVATLPGYRGRGYNTGCLKSAIKVMEADAFDFSLLFTGINAYYNRFGFSDLARSYSKVRIRAQDDFLPGRFLVRTARPQDVPAVRAVYDVYNQNRPIAVRRPEAYWREWLRIDEKSALGPSGLLIVEDLDGSISGYIRTGLFNSAIPYSADEVKVRVIEFGLAELSSETKAEVALALITAVAAELQPTGERILQLEIPITEHVRRALDQIAAREDVEESPITSAMVRLLHPDNLLRSFTMLWNDRWRDAGSPHGALEFETPYGVTTLNADGPFLNVETAAVKTNDHLSAMPQSVLFCLLFGAIEPQTATDNKSQYPLLTALFPRQEMVFWGSDGF